MSICSRCDKTFLCGMVDQDAAEPCWCTRLPVLPANSLARSGDGSSTGRCLCPDCLKEKINALEIGKRENS